jgi:hypothetical protein
MPVPLFAFGFGNLFMLGWLAAAAAPLLIHLWSRHRFREAPWAAMQFLLAAMRKNARRLQLQQWLLLAVRTLIIAFVVLAVAEPYGEALLAGRGGTLAHKIIVIDGSYSMDDRATGASRFNQAKQNAAALVRGSRSADTFTVILMAAPARIIVGRDLLDHNAVIDQIDSLTQEHTAADLAGALTLAQEAVEAKPAARDVARRHEVYILTDLQRLTWNLDSANQAETSTQLRRQITSLAEHSTVAVVDLGQSPANNLAVTRLSAAETFAIVNRPTNFLVTLRQFGLEPRNDCTVELLVDEVPVSEQTIDVPASADTTVRFSHRFVSPGQHTVEVRASGDRLEIDNHRWLVVPVREQVRVLCVAGRPGAARYIANALNPSPAGDALIHPVVVSEGDLADIDFAEFDCIFMCNVAQLTAGETDRLTRFAEQGGGVVFFLGDRVNAANFNATARGSESLLPATIGEVVSQSQFGLDPLDYRHPIVEPFRGRERAGLLTTPITRYHRLAISPDRPGVQVAATMPSGDPFIVTAPLGRGRTVVVATDGSLTSVDAASGEPWTNWPTWPSFLPIVRELLQFATAGQQQSWQQMVGTPISSGADNGPARSSDGNKVQNATSPSATLQLQRPDGRNASIINQRSSAGTDWSYADTNVSGIYTLHSGSDGGPQYFAVNVDTRESDLTRVDPSTLPPELRTLSINQNSTDATTAPTLARAGWNTWLLWPAFALLLIESFLAWQFGRGTM